MAEELPLDRVFDVEINKQTTFPTQQGFGTPMILTTETTGPLDANNRVGIYSSAAGAESDGWPTTSEVYKALATIFSQTVTPTQVKVGWLDAANLGSATACPVITVIPGTINQNLGEIAAGDTPESQQSLLNGCNVTAIQFTLPASGITSVTVNVKSGEPTTTFSYYIFDEADALENTISNVTGESSTALADVAAGRRTVAIVAQDDGVVDTAEMSLTIA